MSNPNKAIRDSMPNDFTILSGSGDYTGNFTGLYAYEDTTFGTGSLCNGVAKDLSCSTFVAGAYIAGSFTRVEVASGVVIAYRPISG